MSRKVTVQSSNGIGFGSILFLIFLTLKLTGHIDWSWWWVTAPLWIPLSIVLGFFVTIFLVAFLGTLLK